MRNNAWCDNAEGLIGPALLVKQASIVDSVVLVASCTFPTLVLHAHCLEMRVPLALKIDLGVLRYYG